jgi:hypothetical protein
MSNYDNNNRIAIWKNDDKKTDKHPDYKGSGTVDNVEYWISAWAKKSGDNPNAPVLSISLSPKEQRVDAPKAVVKEIQLDDDLPF